MGGNPLEREQPPMDDEVEVMSYRLMRGLVLVRPLPIALRSTYGGSREHQGVLAMALSSAPLSDDIACFHAAGTISSARRTVHVLLGEPIRADTPMPRRSIYSTRNALFFPAGVRRLRKGLDQPAVRGRMMPMCGMCEHTSPASR